MKMKMNMKLNMNMNMKIKKEDIQMNVSLEKKKAEAVERMKQLGLYGPTIKTFKNEGVVSISEPPMGAFYWIGKTS